jgi:hypothetical protein
MSKKPQSKTKSKWDDPEESARFLEEAKAAEASDDPRDLERAFKAVASGGSRRIERRT